MTVRRVVGDTRAAREIAKRDRLAPFLLQDLPGGAQERRTQIAVVIC